MDQPACPAPQHADVIDSGFAAGLVRDQQRQQAGGDDVEPPQATGEAPGGLVRVQDWLDREAIGETIEPARQAPRRAGDLAGYPPRRHVRPEVAQQLGAPGDREVLAHQQVGRQPGDVRSPGRRRGRLGREPRGRHVAAATTQPLSDMLNDRHLGFGQIEHLAAHHPGPLGTLQALTAAPTALRSVHHHLVRIGSRQQRGARRAGLAAPLTSTFAFLASCLPALPATGPRRLVIARWRQRRVLRAPTQPAFQLRHPRPELLNDRRLRLHQRPQPGVLRLQLRDPLDLPRHAPQHTRTHARRQAPRSHVRVKSRPEHLQRTSSQHQEHPTSTARTPHHISLTTSGSPDPPPLTASRSRSRVSRPWDHAMHTARLAL